LLIIEANSLRLGTDNTVEQYTRIAAMSRPKFSELDLLRTWIGSSHLGGGCRFLGKDLGGFEQPSVYDDIYQDDLMLLINNRGEDDILTRFLSGPILRAFHCVWQYFKVSFDFTIPLV
jgi:hypothetical protein